MIMAINIQNMFNKTELVVVKRLSESFLFNYFALNFLKSKLVWCVRVQWGSESACAPAVP